MLQAVIGRPLRRVEGGRLGWRGLCFMRLFLCVSCVHQACWIYLIVGGMIPRESFLAMLKLALLGSHTNPG